MNGEYENSTQKSKSQNLKAKACLGDLDINGRILK
jgi:hypothetical protein